MNIFKILSVIAILYKKNVTTKIVFLVF
jgi:hypothetical protein